MCDKYGHMNRETKMGVYIMKVENIVITQSSYHFQSV
jgi:hypothetical protein